MHADDSVIYGGLSVLDRYHLQIWDCRWMLVRRLFYLLLWSFHRLSLHTQAICTVCLKKHPWHF